MGDDVQAFISGTTEGPVQAEILVLRLLDGRLELVGPCGPQPWYVEVVEEDPVEVVGRMCRDNIGEPLLLHSTSWRRARGGVVLTFMVVMPDDFEGTYVGTPIGRAELARSGATSAPSTIDAAQVIEHGLRHLQWLAIDAPLVGRRLSRDWTELLRAYQPEPFRHLREVQPS